MESEQDGAPPRAALVIIDMQREFLSDEGMFRNPVDAERLLVPLEAMIAAARAGAQPVVWVRSEYPTRAAKPAPMRPPRPAGEAFAGVPMNDDHLASGHAGRPCCAPGSPTAELLAPLQALVRDGDVLVTKDRYSAFMGTDLDARLRARGVDSLLLCGVVANTCVRATAADAFFLGYAVTAISDCVGATSPRRLRDGLDAIARWYGDVRPSATILTEARASLTGLGAGDSAIHYGVLSAELAAAALDRVRDEVTWRTMHHKGGVVPRGIAIQGTIAGGVEPIYRHPADEQPALAAWTPTADAIRREVSAFLDQPLNHALIQRYADGNSFINPHADKTLDVARGSAIVNLSLGATRTLLLRAKGGGPTLRIHLPHNSLFVLGWETNRRFVHGIRHDRRADSEKRADERVDGGERISLTMRTIATFRRLRDGRLFGQGARVKREEALADAAPAGDPLDEATAMLEGFGRENRDPDFDWEASYGAGFDALNFQILRDSDDAASEADR